MRKYDELFEMPDIVLFLGNLVFAGREKVRCVIHGELIGMEAKEVLFSGCHGGFPLPRDVRSGRGWTF